jgi:hypothetical protein
LESIKAIGLCLVILLISSGAGKRIVGSRHFGAYAWLFSLPLGLGILATGVFLLGLLGLLHPLWLVAWLVVMGWWGRQMVWETLRSVPGWLKIQFKQLGQLSLSGKAILMGGGVLFLFTFLQALAPPWDVDGLMYHLAVPKRYLELGTIQPLQDNWLSFYPSLIEMLFMFGMALGSDIFARLIHLTYAIWLVLATYALARRFSSPRLGILAAALLASVPIYQVWASAAYIDMGWALYEFLGLLALLEWWQGGKRAWLSLGGVMLGFAMASKYLGLIGALVILLMVVWRLRQRSWKEASRGFLLFIFAAALGCLPWYLKNLIWTGNPLFPLLLTPQGEMGEQFRLWQSYMHSFGAGRSLIETLLTPIYLYTRHQLYATFMGSIELPGLLFPLVICYPFTRRQRWTDFLFAYLVLRYLGWLVGVQQIRYLLPVFPVASILTSYVILEMAEYFNQKRIIQLIGKGLVGGVLAVGVVYGLLYFLSIRPLGVVLGLETKDEFLTRNVPDYAATRFIMEQLPPDSRVMFLWDGRGYYCDQRCLPDVLHAQWTVIRESSDSNQEILAKLREREITHILFSEWDADFILQRDGTGVHRKAVELVFSKEMNAFMEIIYQDEFISLFSLASIK